MMKTAVTVLHELMQQTDGIPEYECISQSGPQHKMLFEFSCKALDEIVVATARSKKEAKQEVARLMLKKLASKGHAVPAPYGLSVPVTNPYGNGAATSSILDTRSYVALLREFCDEYNLGTVEYDLVGDAGPPHLRHFTYRARHGQREHFATATTKKTARQLAAKQIYNFLKQNLSRVTKDFNEEEALARAHDRAMDRSQKQEARPPRLDLGQKISEYHLSISKQIDAKFKNAAVELLKRDWAESPERLLTEVIEALRLKLEYTTLPSTTGTPLSVIHVKGVPPDLAFMGENRDAAALDALEYMSNALHWG